MNWLKKGPELKLPEARVPDFLFDLYYDLKERHLLPLVVVLAISVVVVPIALSHATGSGSAGEEEAALATPSVAPSRASTLAVARSAPGLRDYRRRLRDAHALDPFRTQAKSAEAAAASAEGGTEPGVISEGSSAPAVTEPTAGSPESPAASSPSYSLPSETSDSSIAGPAVTKYASNTLDVRIVTVPASAEGNARSSRAKPAAKVRRGLPELTMLPNRETPAAIFMGTSSNGKKALLLVSSDVQSIFGDGQCVIGSSTCQLLALEAGVPETFVYGAQARTYRIEILKIEKTLSRKPRKASLGKARKQASSGHTGAPESAGRISTAQPR